MPVEEKPSWEILRNYLAAEDSQGLSQYLSNLTGNESLRALMRLAQGGSPGSHQRHSPWRPDRTRRVGVAGKWLAGTGRGAGLVGQHRDCRIHWRHGAGCPQGIENRSRCSIRPNPTKPLPTCAGSFCCWARRP